VGAERESKHFTEVAYDNQATPNNGMHPTANTTALIYLNRAGRQVMPGVMPLKWL
jgi:hypothetical protein